MNRYNLGIKKLTTDTCNRMNFKNIKPKKTDTQRDIIILFVKFQQ